MLIRSTLLTSTRILRVPPSPDDSRRLLIAVTSDRTHTLISRLNTDDCPSILDLHISWDEFSHTLFVLVVSNCTPILVLAALSLESVQFAIPLSGLSDQFAAIYADIHWHLLRRWISCLLSPSTPHPHSLGGCTLWWFNSTSHYYLRALDKSLIDLL